MHEVEVGKRKIITWNATCIECLYQSSVIFICHMSYITCQMSHITCPMSLLKKVYIYLNKKKLIKNDIFIDSFVIKSTFSSIFFKHPYSWTVRRRELTFWDNIHCTPCVLCPVSCVTCQVSHVKSHVKCHISPFEKIILNKKNMK